MKSTPQNEIFLNNILIEKKCGDPERSMAREHDHDFYELYFFEGDSMRYLVNGKAYSLERGNFVFVDRFVYHRTAYDGENKARVVLFFREEIFSAFTDQSEIKKALLSLSETVMLNLDEHATAEAEGALLDLLAEYEREEASPLLLASHLAALLLLLSRYTSSPALLPVRTAEGERVTLVGDMMAYLNAHFAEKITLASLSAQFFVDRFHLCHLFSEIAGVTVLEFLNGRRLSEAKRLLSSTDRSVGEIALAVGFASQNHFNALFKRAYGKTPTAFRRERRL
jgi:AraC-like DNA-binding protein